MVQFHLCRGRFANRPYGKALINPRDQEITSSKLHHYQEGTSLLGPGLLLFSGIPESGQPTALPLVWHVKRMTIMRMTIIRTPQVMTSLIFIAMKYDEGGNTHESRSAL